ncbi:MAG: hypothetical protein PVG78_00255 [Desulfobacterales bacterium]|jgi:hypothetical protein
MRKRNDRPKTPTYYAFYLLFSTDAWRIAMGFVLSVLTTPHLAPPALSPAGRAMLYVMVAAIGWTITGGPARWITRALKKAILGKN